MVKYYYDKYNTIENITWQEPSRTSTGIHQRAVNLLYKGYVWNNSAKKFESSGEQWDGDILARGDSAYDFNSDGRTLWTYVLDQGDATAENSNAKYQGYLSDAVNSTSTTSYSRGTLVQSDVQADGGTYPTNGRHTDGYWYVRKGVVNQSPVITPVGTVPSGSMEVKPSFNYKVMDPDGNTMTVTESIDGITFNTRTGVASGTQLTFTPTDLAWLRTRIKQTVNLTIKADDGKGGVTTVNYLITRTTPAIDLALKTPFDTDVAARRLLLKLEGSIPVDANVSVQVCNNAFDANPTWENATSLVLSGFPHPFTNKIKTAAKWGVSFKVRIERGNSTQSIYLDGIGGAFD